MTTLKNGPKWTHFADDILKYILLAINLGILIEISQMFLPKCPIDIKLALFQVMAWHITGDKPLPEPMIFQLIDT